MSERIFSQYTWAILIWLFFSACTGKEGGRFRAPEFVSAQVEVKGASATFTCMLSSDRVEECGILLDENVIEGVLEGSSFTAMANGLEIGKEHIWSAFARAGGSEIRSEKKTFEVPDGAIPIPDPAFKAWLAERYDINRDGEISLKEAQTIWRINLCTDELGVKSVKGIEYMPELIELTCWGNWVGNFDLSGHPYYYRSKSYRWDNCIGPIGTLESLDISGNPKLQVLQIWNNSALGDLQGSLDLSYNPLLERVNLNMTYLSIPDVSPLCSQLTELRLSHLRGAIPDFTTMPRLKVVDMDFEQTGRREPMDFSHCPDLEKLTVSYTAISLSDLSLNPKLNELIITCCDFSSIDLSGLPGLRLLHGESNYFRTLDVSSNPMLKELILSPMNDDVLETLYIAPGQVIPGVTEDRSSKYIPEYTQIVEKSVE